MLLRILALVVALTVAPTVAPTVAEAAFVTTNESGMDAIFSDLFIFDMELEGIDIVFLPTITHVAASLLTLVDEPGIDALFGLFNTPDTVHAYFVDTVDWCGAFDVAIAGCGNLPGSDFVVESVFAGGPDGAELMAHELGHNLGLDHTDPAMNNLMFSAINGDTSLTNSQIDTIVVSPNIQGSVPNEFITIQPILIQAPEPATAGLVGLGLLAFGWTRRRRA